MDPYNHGPQGGVITPMGTPGNVGTPGYNGIIPDQGIVPDVNPKPITPKTLTTHILIEKNGVGDQCKAGDSEPVSWNITFTDPLTTKDELISVVQTAAQNDTRLRTVHILDDQIDMYYLQPAKIWGFIPTNYYLQVSANANTLRISLEKPKWLGRAKNSHAEATSAFSTFVPQYLNDKTVAQLDGADIINRDAKMIEIVSAIMYQVHVSPYSNSFFVCYIMPFLIYIILILVLLLVAVWFIIRRLRKGSRFLVAKIHAVELGEDSFETENTGDQHVTHFKLPKQ
jgi:hypothetical protein